MKYFRYLRLWCMVACMPLWGGCRNGTPQAEIARKSSVVAEDMLQIIRPRYGDRLKEGQEVVFEVRRAMGVDSVVITTDEGRVLGRFVSGTDTLRWKAVSAKLGTKTFHFKIFAGGATAERSLKIILTDKNTPAELQYKVVGIYPHATNAYTQGLVFADGILYESDGQYGMSALRKVQIETGNTLQQHLLPAKYFAEGIALYGNKIYQITWRENTCFVYDKESFRLIDQKSYDIAEGWGLTTDGQYLYMTDGSNRVYTIEPETFSVVDMFEVVDDAGPVDNLNELEYVDGLIYANVYQTDFVVIIDLKQKRLAGKINFAHLLQPSDIQPNTDVLNGIAYNPKSKRFYITGKNWPKLFEVEVIHKVKQNKK